MLIKKPHRCCRGIAHATARASAPHLLKIEVEVTNIKELGLALKAGADAVLLDNFSPNEVTAALSAISKAKVRPVVEVSGGINEANLALYAQRGVDVISTGSITHSVKAVDLSLLVRDRKSS